MSRDSLVDRANSLVESIINGAKDEHSRAELVQFMATELDLVGAKYRTVERGRCAKVCEDYAAALSGDGCNAALACAAMIRKGREWG